MRITKEDCTGLVIDIQERLHPHMDQAEELLRRTGILLQGLRILGVPVMLTEQYPEGLGGTVKEIKQVLSEFHPIRKLAFSCCDEPAYMMALEQTSRWKVIICGIETHVCVLQTVIDLTANGFTPVVVTDCTSSRKPGDKTVGLERMRQEGAVLTTLESILFELARVSGTDEFRAISRLVK
jgi:nicotinamidase-related amidase